MACRADVTVGEWHNTAQNANDSATKQSTNQPRSPASNHSLNQTETQPLAARATDLWFSVCIVGTSASISVGLGSYLVAVGMGGAMAAVLDLTQP